MEEEKLEAFKRKKEELIRFMQTLGFENICDITCQSGVEMVGSKMRDNESMWWRTVETEGSGFTRLFKGSILALYRELLLD